MAQAQTETKHTTLYFEDGDLELSAEAADGSRYLFRVYRAQLGRVSPVFRDMFAMGGARNESVRMYDPAEDLADFLESVYMPSSLTRRLKRTTPARTALELAGLCRAATKYGVEDIVAVVVEHIADQWPKTLAEWDASYPVWTSSRASAETVENVPEPVSAIRFAREFDLPSILPAAYYFLSVQSTNVDSPSPPPAVLPVARWDLVDLDILLCLMRGRDRVRRAALPALKASWYDDYENGCKDSEAKNAHVAALLRGDDAAALHEQYDHLEILRRFASKDFQPRNLCSSCRNADTIATEAKRAAIWQSLPELFE
ncbi:hypothetical protein PsYK624_130780 [Phanerochaete sordida]|uniref:BTB domain-containing protein n=1 Tax=Phanerochaete sordida TaxID=48140 RepID=A0A9P3GLC6_9APHY|nr:hypothetical protein PsYK624_130780 [Phanerochaete sordida]